jgi:hypothetical protein
MFNAFSDQPKDTKIGYITKTEYGFVLDPNDYVFGEDLTVNNKYKERVIFLFFVYFYIMYIG